tara:strand:+ start:548 stop:1189 length:642 start_codon:yes stop_codon:yes gene_type:complete
MRNVLDKSMPISLDNHLNFTDKDFKEVDDEIIKVTNKLPALLIGQSKRGKYEFISEEESKGKQNWEAFPLVDSFYGAPDLYRKREWNKVAKRLFPKLISFVNQLPIESIGRASILKVPAGRDTPAHIDPQFQPNASPMQEYDRILNINFGERKYLYMLDSMTKVRHYFEGRINWLDISDWHGVEASPFDTFTLKLDVKLEPKFRNIIRQIYKI